MKICMISGSLPTTRCGVGDFTGQLAKKIGQVGHELTLLTSKHQQLVSYPGIDILPISSNWGWVHVGKILKQIKQLNPDIVHIHYPSCGYGKGLAINLILPLLRIVLPQVKGVITLHEYAMFSFWGKLRLLVTLIAAHNIICTNSYDQKKIRGWVGTKKSCVIPLGSVIGDQAGKTIEFPSRHATINLLNFGTLMPNKGWEAIIKALAILKKNQVEFRLLALSSLEPDNYFYHKKIDAEIKLAQLEHNIHFTGYLTADQIKPLMAQDDIVIMPFSEGLKLNRSSFIAMLGYQKAIITTDKGLALEYIEPQETCWMVPVNDPQSLANAIERLWQEPELCAQLQAGAKQAYQNFTWSVIREQTLDLYHRMK